jgi:hypothetical protein
MYLAKPTSLYETTYGACFIREQSAVPTVAHICSFSPGKVSASSARAYFPVLNGSLAAVTVPLLEIAARLKSMPPRG